MQKAFALYQLARLGAIAKVGGPTRYHAIPTARWGKHWTPRGETTNTIEMILDCIQGFDKGSICATVAPTATGFKYLQGKKIRGQVAHGRANRQSVSRRSRLYDDEGRLVHRRLPAPFN